MPVYRVLKQTTDCLLTDLPGNTATGDFTRHSRISYPVTDSPVAPVQADYSPRGVTIDTRTTSQVNMSMNHPARTSLRCLPLCACLSACAVPALPHFASLSAVDEAIPPAPAGLDQYSAWIPASDAPTASVAQAMVHVALGEARQRAGTQLCGYSLQTGEIIESTGPLRVMRTNGLRTKQYWYYRISQQPGLPGCGNADEKPSYQALRDALPRWIELSPAGVDSSRAIGLLDTGH